MSAGKKHRKLSKRGKKIIRRAVGAILMITAIIIAALPSDNVKADTTNVAEKYKIYPNRVYNTMSDDFDLAITEGANLVRVGTALFGKRNYMI